MITGNKTYQNFQKTNVIFAENLAREDIVQMYVKKNVNALKIKLWEKTNILPQGLLRF